MIRFEWNSDEGFKIVDGIDEFIRKTEKNGPIEVVGASDGKTYYYHEVGDQIHILNQTTQHALIRVALSIIQDAAVRPSH